MTLNFANADVREVAKVVLGDLLGEVRTRTGGALPGITPSNTYPTRDGGYVVIAGNSDPIFRRRMAAIGRPDLADDPALRNNAGRSQPHAASSHRPPPALHSMQLRCVRSPEASWMRCGKLLTLTM